MCMDTILMVKWMQGEKIQPGLKVNLIYNTGVFWAKAEKDPQGFLCRDVFGDITENNLLELWLTLKTWWHTGKFTEK